MANEIYSSSWWGSPTANGWGSIYYEYTDSFEFVIDESLVNRFNSRVIAEGGIVEGNECLSTADFNYANWTYFFRVVDDGGTVESLKCVKIQ